MVRKLFLLLASYFFYASLDFKFLPILILSSVLNFFFGLWLGVEDNPKSKKAILIFTIACNLLLLATFKYYDFILENFINFVALFGVPVASEKIPYLNLVLPLGVSFFTFQSISYLVDIYKQELSYKNSMLDVMLFISFFPHLVAGPIVKANEFIPQLKNKVDPLKIPVFYAISLILIALFKKIVIANYLGTDIVDPVFESPSRFSSIDIAFAVYCYAVQIYCDFSAYSDMAIAFATLLGYEFPINFNQPYQAMSLQDFWRRWHISLSSWLRDYLYKPLGGSLEGKLKTYRNLIITMFLGGLWHGASWNFIIWGLIHGIGLCCERYVSTNKINYKIFKIKKLSFLAEFFKKPTIATFFKRVFIFHFVCFAWVFFRAPSLDKSVELILQFFSFNFGTEVISAFYLVLLMVGMSFHFVKPLKQWKIPAIIFKRPRLAFSVIASLLITIITTISPDGIAPFIYFRF